MATDNILIKTRQYLQDTIGSGTIAEPKLWTNADHLPFFLQSSYQYYELDLFNHSCLLMISNTQEGETPAVVRKHWLAVSKHYKGDVIYLVEVVSSYNRKRLIEHRVPFLIPGNQLYIPMLGLDLREYFKPSKLAEKTKLSGPAQAVILREILHNDCSGLPAKELANILGYTPMTITRAINELTDRELAEAKKVGREKHLNFPCTGRSLWEAALPLLHSPVTKRILVAWRGNNTLFDGRMAGEAALANYTSLADAGIHQWAITSEKWSDIAKQDNVHVLEKNASSDDARHRRDKDATELELWSYNPSVIALNRSCVDPLSLWLSLENNKDERIELACETLLKQVWSSIAW